MADMRRWDGMTPEAGQLFEEFADWVKRPSAKFRCTELAAAIKILSDYQLHTAALAEAVAQSNPT